MTLPQPANRPVNGGGTHPSYAPTPKSERRPWKTPAELWTCWSTKHGTDRHDSWDRTEGKSESSDGLESEVYREHPVPLPKRPQDRRHRLHLELRQCHEAGEDRQIDNGPPAPSHFLHQERAAVETRTRLVNNLQSPLLEHHLDLLWKSKSTELTPGYKMEVPRVSAIQVGGDGMEPGNPNGAPQQSTSWRRRTANTPSTPPAAVREARNLQNFFPLPRRAEEEEVSEQDERNETEDQKKRLAGWRNRRAFGLLLLRLLVGRLQEMQIFCQLTRRLVCRNHLADSLIMKGPRDNFSTAFSRMSVGKSSVEPNNLALQRSMKDSKEIESFTLANTASWLLRTTLARTTCGLSNHKLARGASQKSPPVPHGRT